MVRTSSWVFSGLSSVVSRERVFDGVNGWPECLFIGVHEMIDGGEADDFSMSQLFCFEVF